MRLSHLLEHSQMKDILMLLSQIKMDMLLVAMLWET